MPKILTKQIQKINNACSNNWQLDTHYFLTHGEKTLMKCIELDTENYLKFSLSYNSRNQITLHISKYNHKKGEVFACSSGLGKRTILAETPATRKNYNKLIEYTHELDNNNLMEINKNTPVSSGYGIIVPSEEF